MKLSYLKFVAGPVAGLLLTSQALASTGAPTTVSQQVQQVDNRTQLLEQEVSELQSKVRALSAPAGKGYAKADTSSPYIQREKILTDKDVEEAVHAHSLVSFGPYLNVRTSFNGSELVVNSGSIRESARLLQRRYNVQQAAKAAGKPIPSIPHLVLSGVLGGQTYYKSNYGTDHASNINLTDAEVDAYIVMNDWITGFMALTYDDAAGDSARPEENSNVRIKKAFMMIGDLARTPFYGTLGQLYVPFGRYSSSMIAGALTKNIARTKERALLVGYKQPKMNSPYGEVYVYKSSSGFGSERNMVNDGGVDLGYDFKINDRVDGQIGASVISNIADSSGIQHGSSTSGGFAGMGSDQVLENRVPGADVYMHVSFDPFRLDAEYVTATHAFDGSVGLDGNNGKPAKPAAQNVELAYTFTAFNLPSSFAVGYGHTSDAVMLGQPVRRYAMAFNTSVWKHTLETLEFRREYNYSHADTTPVTGDSASNLGKINNVVTAQIYVYF